MSIYKCRTKKVYDVGTIGVGKYNSRNGINKTKEYNAWTAMLQRCYDIKLHIRHPSYINCTVYNDWLNFQNFAKWYEENYIENYQLDKDLLIEGNKIYSPQTCCFVPCEINLSIIKPIKKRIYPLGVYKHYNKFVVHIKEDKISNYKGIFSTIMEASICYKKEKEKQLVCLAEKYKNVISNATYNALLNYKVNIND